MEKYKRLLYFLASICLLCCGVIVGTYVQKQYSMKSNNSINARTAIAIVNQDLGVTYNGEKISYSEAFIGSLQGDFSVVSAKSAEVGFKNGTYGGVIIIPSNMSEKVVSINAENPEQVLLSYSINKQLSAEKYIEVYENIASAQASMRSVLSYVYMASIFDEIHTGQDSVKTVTDNDIQDLQATEDLMMTRFMEGLKIDDIPEIEPDFKEYDVSGFLVVASQYANDIRKTYSDEYNKAIKAYGDAESDIKNSLAEINTSMTNWERDIDTYIAKIESAMSSDLESIENIQKNFDEYYSVLELYRTNIDQYYQHNAKNQKIMIGYYQELVTYHNQLNQYRDYLLSFAGSSDIPFDVATVDPININFNSFDESLIPERMDKTILPSEWNLQSIGEAPRARSMESLFGKLKNSVNSYDPSDFFSEKNKKEIESLNSQLENNLLSEQRKNNAIADQNYKELENMENEYRSYVTGMRGDVISKYYEDSEELQDALNKFYEQKQANTEENALLFSSISELLPYSRKDGLINKPVVEFVVEPVMTQETTYEPEIAAENEFSESYFGVLIFVVLIICSLGTLIIGSILLMSKLRTKKK